MTLEDIEARNFSYASATYRDPLRWEKFLVPSPFKGPALEQARTYAAATWGDDYSAIRVYPRTYVKEARLLFAQGRVAP